MRSISLHIQGRRASRAKWLEEKNLKFRHVIRKKLGKKVDKERRNRIQWRLLGDNVTKHPSREKKEDPKCDSSKDSGALLMVIQLMQ
jgi:hypothetical protein